jgi:hypothetical protein
MVVGDRQVAVASTAPTRWLQNLLVMSLGWPMHARLPATKMPSLQLHSRVR